MGRLSTTECTYLPTYLEVHLVSKDKTQLLGVVDLTGKGLGGYLEVILALFEDCTRFGKLTYGNKEVFTRCAHCTPTMPP